MNAARKFGGLMRAARSNARKAAMQALYQWQMTGQNLTLIEIQFLEEERLQDLLENLGEDQVDVAQQGDFTTLFRGYFSDLLHGVPTHLVLIDKALTEFVDRPVDSIDPVERAILRIGVYELQQHLDTPYRVILNEGINLAKEFGADGSHRYVNGILDKVAGQLRAVEVTKHNAKKPS